MIIEINVSSMADRFTLKANTTNNSCIINDNKVNINTYDFAKKLCSILAGWRFDYGVNPCAMDMESFNVKIIENDKTFEYSGEGDYPNSYNAFKQLLKEVAKC